MSQVAMQKVSFVATKSERGELMTELGYYGAFEPIDCAGLLDDERWSAVAQRSLENSDLRMLEANLSTVEQAIAALAPFEEKKSLFAGRRKITPEQLREIAYAPEQYYEKCAEVNEYTRATRRQNSEINRLKSELVSLEPWRSVDLPLNSRGTATTSVIFGTVPAAADVGAIRARLEEELELAVLAEAGESKTFKQLYVIVNSELEDEAASILRDYAFSRVNFKYECTAAEAIGAAEKRIAELTEQIENMKLRLAECAQYSEQLKALYDAIKVRIDVINSDVKALVTERCFMMRGYVPAKAEAQLRGIFEKYNCSFEFEQLEEGEEAPVVLDNPAAVSPYEAVLELYGLPGYGKFDPTKIMAPFFFIFFGMMLSDAGYGLILAVVGAIAYFKLDLKGFAKKLFGLVFQCGVSTVIFGAVYGSFFGDIIGVVSSMRGGNLSFNGLFSPLEKPIELMVACFLLGAVHLFIGMGISACGKIKSGRLFDAICDEILWIVLIVGLPLMIIYPKVGTALVCVGAGGIVLTGGRDKKNVVMKFLSGLLKLYDITGYLSDILSYSRIMALGLATGVVASVVNTLGSMLGVNFLGYILFAVVFVVGHALNLAINALGAYVHTSRLQYVEFFSKFYESGGRPFEPISVNTKYNKIEFNGGM